MKVLVACEESQRVCIEFRKKGHEAYSCDIIDCSGGHPEWHIKENVIPLITGKTSFLTCDGMYHKVDKWDMMIAFPPCTDLCVSGARWFKEKQADGRQQRSIDFFMYFAESDIPKIAIENPIGIMSSVYRKPDQIIHPWMFGDNFQKSTCLWLKGLPELIPEITEEPEMPHFEWIDKKTGRKKRQGMWYKEAFSLPAKERAIIRSKTFPGIAKAMAEQWGD